jgi:hypothetical protein
MAVAFGQDSQKLAGNARYIQLEQLRHQDAIEEASDILVFECVEHPRYHAADGFGELRTIGRTG